MKRPYYIFSIGRIRRQQNTLFFEKAADAEAEEPVQPEPQDEVLADNADFEAERDERERVQKRVIPIEDIESLYCFGEITLNSKLLNFLAQQHIPAHFFNYYGFYNGSFVPRDYLLSGEVLVKQVQFYTNAEKRLPLAKEMVLGGVDNMLKNLHYYQNRGRDLTAPIGIMQKEQRNMQNARSINELMTAEGRLRGAYFSAWDTIIDADFKFEQRSRRPPKNAVNALISFGNSMLYTAVLGEVYHTQLNPTISYLHEPGARRYSLCLDLAEIFKPSLVDRMIFSLLNQGQIKKNHFEEKLNFCYLNEAGRKIVVQAWDERMKTTIKHRRLNRSVSYRRLLRLEAYKLIKHITADKVYKAFRMWW